MERIIDIKYGIDGGYISCGKQEKNCIVEIETSKDNKPFYCLLSLYEHYAGYVFSDTSYYDAFLRQDFLHVPKYTLDVNLKDYKDKFKDYTDVYKNIVLLHTICLDSNTIQDYLDKDLDTLTLDSLEESIEKVTSL